MPRIAGIDIPLEKRVEVALTYIHGVGRYQSARILKEAGVDPNIRSKSLTDDQLSRIVAVIDRKLVVEGQLRRTVQQNVQRLKDIGCYRGMRHKRSLPVRGQRTKTNARTRKGPRKTVAGKKVEAPK
mgnify:CR=1 FL=1